MIKKTALLICLVLSFLLAEKTEISLIDFVRRGLEHHPLYKAALSDLDLSKAELGQTRAMFDVILEGAVGVNKNDNGLGIPLSFGNGVLSPVATNLFSSVGIKGIIPYTGIRYRAGLEMARSGMNTGPLNDLIAATNALLLGILPVPEISSLSYSPVLKLDLSIPMLRNWAGIIDSYPLRQKKLSDLLVRQSVAETRETIIVDLCDLYLEWYRLHRTAGILSDSIANSGTLLKSMEEKALKSLVGESEVSQVREMNLAYRRSQVLVSSSLQAMDKRIAFYYTGGNDGGEWMPAEKPVLPELFPGRSISNSRQYRLLELTGRLLHNEKKVTVNELMPELDYFFSIERTGSGSERSEAMARLNYDDFMTGLKLSYPLPVSLSRGKRKASRAKLAKWRSELRQFQREYALGEDRLKSMISAYDQVLKLNSDILKELNLQIREEEKKYRQGRSDLFLIIEKKNRLLKSMTDNLADEINRASLVIQLLALYDGLDVLGESR